MQPSNTPDPNVSEHLGIQRVKVPVLQGQIVKDTSGGTVDAPKGQSCFRNVRKWFNVAADQCESTHGASPREIQMLKCLFSLVADNLLDNNSSVLETSNLCDLL